LFKSNEKLDDIEDEEIEEEGLSSRWKWFSLIEKLSQGDITKFEDVYEQNFISCLNLLSFWKERDEYLRRLEKQRNKNKNY